MNIYNADKKIFTYGKKDQDNQILEEFKSYFLNECIKSDIMVNEMDYYDEMKKVYTNYEMNNQGRSGRKRSVF